MFDFQVNTKVMFLLEKCVVYSSEICGFYECLV